jgi:serine phosphatase RsbU (regulator of sigma subunit)
MKENEEVASSAEIDALNNEAWEIRRSDLRKSWALANETERLSILNGYQDGLAESLRTLGYCLWRFGDLSQSLEKSLIAVDIFRAIKNKKGEADTLNNVGAVYMHQGDHENRLACNKLCLKLRTEINDNDGVAGSENNIGETYMEMGNLAEAEKWFAKCLSNPNSSVQVKAWAWHNTTIIFSKTGAFEKSFDAFRKSLALSESVRYQVLSVSTKLHFAETRIASGDTSDEVLLTLQQALETSLETGLREEMHLIYLCLSELEEKRGNESKAFEWFRKYHAAYRELFNENSNQRIINIQTQYEIESARKEADFERTKHRELKMLMEQIALQKNEIAQKNLEITDSIRYASRIQLAALTTKEYIAKHSPFELFIMYKPKDIVSGDFYWASLRQVPGETESCFYLAVCDSTGHGVPGAFMSLLNISYLNEAVNEKNIFEPHLIFDYVRERLINNLSQEEQKDGMDGTLLRVNYETKEISYAAAYNAPEIVRNGEVITLLADKMPIGKGELTRPFNKFTLETKPGDMVYLFTDGFADQFGGTDKHRDGKKFKNRQLRELMKKAAEFPVEKQSAIFEKAFDDWRGDLYQVDDVLLIGIKIR